MIKLIISDMDGTIIGKDEKLPHDLPALVKALHEKGILFTVATGRAEPFMAPLVEAMGVTCPYVCSNGATIMDGTTAVARKQFPVSTARAIIEFAETVGFSVVFTCNGKERVPYVTDWLIGEGIKRNTTYVADPLSTEEWDSYCVEKILIMDDNRNIGIAEPYCQGIDGFSYVRYRHKAIEMMAPGANKASGIMGLLEMLQIAPEDVLVIGDDDNDREMFSLDTKAAGVSNCSPNVIHLVDYLCQNPQFEGVKEAIAHYCEVTV